MSDTIPTPPTGPVHTPPTGPVRGGSFFQRKIGGLPIWALGLIFGLMLAVGFWYKAHKATSSAGTGATSAAFTGDGSTADDGLSSYTGNSGVTSDGSSTSSYSGESQTTNAEWAANAENELVQQGEDPTTVANALSAYLAGQTLTAAEQTVVNQALSNNGTPPNGVVPVNTSSPSINYTVVAGDSLVSIAEKWYGDPSQWKNIYQANVGIIGSDPIAGLHHGQTLVLPGQGLLSTPLTPTEQALPSNHQYTIQYGDTGFQIAEKFYGDASEWATIYALNKSVIPNQNVLPVGTTIKLP